MVKAIVVPPEAGRTQWANLSQLLAASEADLLIVPSFAAIADTVLDVLEEIVRLPDAPMERGGTVRGGAVLPGDG